MRFHAKPPEVKVIEVKFQIPWSSDSKPTYIQYLTKLMGGFLSIKSLKVVDVEATATVVGRRRDEQRQRRQHYILA